ncbi:AMP-binding protein [Celerinatantimonas sp. MCCC 1A17872]|uniref:AMP-binding protein n=1 Tax=Celerinatantimonas sp. MCCC 1A17872 TaxID=3177514 RepID=UPI0038C267EB
MEKITCHQGEALWHDGTSLSYKQLLKQAQLLVRQWGKERQLIVLRAYHRPETVIIYLAALIGRHPVILFNPKLNRRTEQTILKRYQPNWCYLNGRLQGQRQSQQSHQFDDDLAVMLTTSGSTGSAKLVQLSLENISSNAASIAQYLQMKPSSRVLSSLPLAYSYGLSLLNSHLWIGGTTVLTEPDPLSREFWQLMREQRITQLAGVPYSYQIYEQLRMRRSEWPDLEVLTQAGGHMDANLAERFANWASLQGKEFFIMYGQTEATARIAYLPATQVLARSESIGVAIPGGTIEVVDEQNRPLVDGTIGELIYRGPNVMLGYAAELKDLAQPERPEFLKTGDLGYRDSQGFFYITGRLKRIVKLAGVRTALDSLESALAAQGIPATCCGGDNALRISVLTPVQRIKVESYLREELQLHPSLFKVAVIADLPHNINGKLDYIGLVSMIEKAI